MKLVNLYAVLAAFTLMIVTVGCNDADAPVIDAQPAVDAPVVEGDAVEAPGETVEPVGEVEAPAGE